MFGMGFLEIFLILVIAIISLGPEKLPNAAVDIAKMFKKLRSSVDDVKSTFDEELSKTGLKSEADKFRDTMGIDNLSSLSLENIMDDNLEDRVKKEKKKKKSKKEKITHEDAEISQVQSSKPVSVASAPTSVKDDDNKDDKI